MQAGAYRDRVHQGLQFRGRGLFDHACHQRCSAIQGKSQARTARSARGQDGAGGGEAACGPLSAAGCRTRIRRLARCWMVVEPGVPAEAERAVDQALVAADRSAGPDLEVGPAQLVFDLLDVSPGVAPCNAPLILAFAQLRPAFRSSG